MSYKLMFILNAIVAFAIGAAFLFVTATTLRYFGTETRVPELLLGRFFGSAMLTLGLFLWFAKDAAEESVQKNMALALLIGAVVGLIVTVIGISPASGVIRSNGWVAIMVYVVIALGYVFLLFLKPRQKE
jgi:peptidoglycan/LPS O-acetylase OafA/YrhL